MTEKKVGRPTKFNEIISEKILEYAEQGKTEEEIAKLVGINPRTIWYWKNQNQSFYLALKESKSIADDLVEASLFRKAVGYQKPVVHITKDDRMIEFVEDVPPDTTAAIFWMKNRRPDEWREKHEVEVSGKFGDEIVEQLSKDRRKDLKESE
jgi:hypothetical protein